MNLEIKTLTPLWTGGVNGKVERIHETGIIGSMRWWYEVMVRGLGGHVCDPSQGKCAFDAEKYAESTAPDERQRLRDAGLCDVCQVFGATGWRRRFRIRIFDENVSNAQIAPTVSLTDRQYTDRQGKTRTPTWYFRDPTRSGVVPNTPKEGYFRITVQSLESTFQLEIIAGLIQFIADWAALGARVQMGFGVIEPANGRIDTKPLYDWLVVSTGNETYPNLPSLPSLRNVFFARVTPKSDSFSEKDTFNLKYDLRQLFADASLRHFIMGKAYMNGPRKGERIAAKVKMSRPYGDGLMRVWGWIPEEADVYRGTWDRNAVVDAIYRHLKTNYDLQIWRELNSSRDTETPNNGDVQTFLESLLAIEEEGDAA